ncbi:hemoglobin [Emericellopsis atlantica]|uniref:nitric oxide dioxygenase n=1 Tax=Emericellopsis atlantica TaxID=2614577 RepID=A0A9P7ZQ74_9HYPO|nr:hemoglobin [Emericellopsis atlantica]KAG9255782.1 hemoglobin [Emericellopsis atlantica]
MSLTYRQSTLIRGSLPMLRAQGETITSSFYASLLRAHPELHNIFNSANQATGRQPRALLNIILAFAAAPNHTAELIPRLERVCQKHCSLGITPDQYDLLGKYLLRSFGEILGDRYTAELREAWEKAYSLLARMLIGREVQLYRQFGKWAGQRIFRIEDKVAEVDDIYSFYLWPVDKTPLPLFTPGQYVSVRVDVPQIGYLQSRQYSLSEAPNEEYYRISVKRDRGVPSGANGRSVDAAHLKPGLVSNLLINDYNIGDTLSVSHPAGGFGFDSSTAGGMGPLVFLSAGVGATPLMSILNSVLESPDVQQQISWIHCSRRKPLFEDHIRTVGRRHKNFHSRFWRSMLAEQEQRETHNPERDGVFESVRTELERVERSVLGLDHGAAEYFICGPDAFAASVRNFLLEQGVGELRIRCEWFSTGELEAS